MLRKLFLTFLFVLSSSGVFFSQGPIDSISRKPPVRGYFRWIISEEMAEEGNITDNLKTGEWKRYFNGGLTGKTLYSKGLAVAEFWHFNNEMKPRYFLSEALDTMTVNEYDMNGRLIKVVKNVVDIKTASLNYSLLTEDTVFKKKAVTEIRYQYELWKHRNDMVVVTETTGGIANKKYFVSENNTLRLWFETNDKGDFITGKKKEFLKEEEKSKKFAEGKKQ